MCLCWSLNFSRTNKILYVCSKIHHTYIIMIKTLIFLWAWNSFIVFTACAISIKSYSITSTRFFFSFACTATVCKFLCGFATLLSIFICIWVICWTSRVWKDSNLKFSVTSLSFQILDVQQITHMHIRMESSVAKLHRNLQTVAVSWKRSARFFFSFACNPTICKFLCCFAKLLSILIGIWVICWTSRIWNDSNLKFIVTSTAVWHGLNSNEWVHQATVPAN